MTSLQRSPQDLDGTVVYRFGTGAPLFDITSIGTADVSAIEFYVGAARIPLQYATSSSDCGVLLIWTKQIFSDLRPQTSDLRPHCYSLFSATLSSAPTC